MQVVIAPVSRLERPGICDGSRTSTAQMRRACRIKGATLMNATVLWIIAVILVVVGVIQLLQGQIILGIVLLIAAALVGPGGYSLFRTRT
jgi:hypothetical protein